MDITEIRIRQPEPTAPIGLLAYCSMTIDDAIAIHDIKIKQMRDGILLVMPSRRLTDQCPKCRHRNDLTAHYCNNCGDRLASGRFTIDDKGRPHLEVNVAHPTTKTARKLIEDAVFAAYHKSVAQKQSQPPDDQESSSKL